MKCRASLLVLAAVVCLSIVTITVFAASSLTGAFTQIGKDFQAANAGAKVAFNFAASDDLASQIESSGGADVFASASSKYMDELSSKVGVTGLSLLAFLGAGYSHLSKDEYPDPANPGRVFRFGEIVKKGNDLQFPLATDGEILSEFC